MLKFSLAFVRNVLMTIENISPKVSETGLGRL